jgi:hypothetical protein
VNAFVKKIGADELKDAFGKIVEDQDLRNTDALLVRPRREAHRAVEGCKGIAVTSKQAMASVGLSCNRSCTRLRNGVDFSRDFGGSKKRSGMQTPHVDRRFKSPRRNNLRKHTVHEAEQRRPRFPIS